MSSVNFVNGGLDVQGIVDNLILVEREPIRRLEKQSKNYQDKVSAYQKFNTKLLSLKTSIESLLYKDETVPFVTPSSFDDRLKKSAFALRTATSSSEAILTATGGKGVNTGNYSVTVSNLAAFHTYGSNNLTSDTATLTKTGTLVIQKGTETAVTVTIDATNNTLNGIKNEINSKNAGFTASIINDGSATPYRLIITSNDSGTANALSITNNLNQGTDADVTFAQTVAAEDASLTVNGVTVTKSSNTVTDAIEGVTLNLKSESATAVTVTVEHDLDAIVEEVKDFVSKYNDILSYITSQFKYDSTKKQAGLLSGDFTLRDAQNKLSSTVTQSISSDNAALTVLSQVGVKVSNDGSLTVDDTKLKDSLSSNFRDTAHIFLADATSGSETISIGPQLLSQLKGLTDPLDGSVFHAQDAAQQNVTLIDKQIENMEERLDVRREILISQFSKADIALRQLSSLQSSLTSQVATLRSF